MERFSIGMSVCLNSQRVRGTDVFGGLNLNGNRLPVGVYEELVHFELRFPISPVPDLNLLVCPIRR